MGPLLFSLTIHPLLSSLKSALAFGYLDNVTVGGAGASVEEDVSRLMRDGKAIGLSLNIGKCELIASRPTVKFPIISSFTLRRTDEANLLGAPLEPGPSMDSALNTQLSNIHPSLLIILSKIFTRIETYLYFLSILEALMLII